MNVVEFRRSSFDVMHVVDPDPAVVFYAGPSIHHARPFDDRAAGLF